MGCAVFLEGGGGRCYRVGGFGCGAARGDRGGVGGGWVGWWLGGLASGAGWLGRGSVAVAAVVGLVAGSVYPPARVSGAAVAAGGCVWSVGDGGVGGAGGGYCRVRGCVARRVGPGAVGVAGRTYGALCRRAPGGMADLDDAGGDPAWRV